MIEENIFEYFEEVDDPLFSDFVDTFVYRQSSDDPEVHALIDRFLKDNELELIYLNYLEDLMRTRYFRKSSLSQVNMMNNIFYSLLSLSHNRFRRYVRNH